MTLDDLRAALASLCADLTDTDQQKAATALQVYTGELERFAPHVNLVSQADLPRIIPHHILPAVALGREIRLHPHRKILDVGSGGGLPGIPLAITLPESEFVLVEARRRRSNFLRHCVRHIPLHNVTVVNDRAEHLAEGAFDIALSRAVGGLQQLRDSIASIMCPHGLLLATQPADHLNAHIDHVMHSSTLTTSQTLASLHIASCG